MYADGSDPRMISRKPDWEEYMGLDTVFCILGN